MATYTSSNSVAMFQWHLEDHITSVIHWVAVAV